MDNDTRKHVYMLAPMVLGLLVIVVLVLKDDSDRLRAAPGPQTVNVAGRGNALKSDAAPLPAAANRPLPPQAPVPAASSPAARPSVVSALTQDGSGPPERDPDDWLTDAKAKQITEASPERVEKGKAVFKAKGCATCHIVPGGPAAVLIALPLAHWQERIGKIFNSDFFENRLWFRMARKNANTKRAVGRIRATARGKARLAVWLDEKLNEPMFDKGRRFRIKIKMPPVKNLEQADREALMAYLFSIE